MTELTYMLHDHCTIQAVVPEARISDEDIAEACQATPLWVKRTLEEAFFPSVHRDDLSDMQKLDLLVCNAIVHKLLDFGNMGSPVPWDGMLNSYDWQEPRQLSFFMNLREVWSEMFPKHPSFEDGDYGRRISRN